MTEEIAKYRNPRWIDKENRSLFCEILVGQSYRPAQINVGNIEEGLVNEDFNAIMEIFTEEEIDTNTESHKDVVIEQEEKDAERVEKTRPSVEKCLLSQTGSELRTHYRTRFDGRRGRGAEQRHFESDTPEYVFHTEYLRSCRADQGQV